MEKWEYRTLLLNALYAGGQVGEVFEEDAQHGWQSPPRMLRDVLKEYGEEGWELVGVSQGAIMTFKRRKP